METRKHDAVQLLFSGEAKEQGGRVVAHPASRTVMVTYRTHPEHYHVLQSLSAWLERHRGINRGGVHDYNTFDAWVDPGKTLRIRAITPGTENPLERLPRGEEFGTPKQVLENQDAMDIIQELASRYRVKEVLFGESNPVSLKELLARQLPPVETMHFGETSKGGIFVLSPAKNLIGISYGNPATLEHYNLAKTLGVNRERELAVEGGIDATRKRIWIRTAKNGSGPLAPTEENVKKTASHLIGELKRKYNIEKVEYSHLF